MKRTSLAWRGGGLRWAALSLVLLTGCFGSVDRWRDPQTLEVNRGALRYVYRMRPFTRAPRTQTAVPVVSVPPERVVEVGAIEVELVLGGVLPPGVRNSEVQFYDELAALASMMGGTHFHVRSGARGVGGHITQMTVGVLRAEDGFQASPGAIQRVVAQPAPAEPANGPQTP